MIQRAGNMEVEVREKMKDGKGAIPVTHLLRQIQMKGKCRFFGHMLINPGCSIGLHRHDKEEEIYYILKGKGLMLDNGIKQEVNVGDVIITGDGAEHSIENVGNEPLEVLGVILVY
jgi:mannose-6-phosphate isomerase-like protein (cupin superfamily)